MPNDNPFLGYLEDKPEANYFSYQNEWKSPNQKKFFQSQFSIIQNQYLGQLGQWVRQGSQGQSPQFGQFLTQFPWQQQFQEQTHQERGVDTSRYNPFTRWMV